MDEFGFPHGRYYSRCRVGAKEQIDSKEKVLALQSCFRLRAVFQEGYACCHHLLSGFNHVTVLMGSQSVCFGILLSV